MDASTYKRRRKRGGLLRLLFIVLAVVFVLCLLYVVSPVPTQRAVLLGSDARADEASRSDTIMVAAAGWSDGVLAVPRDTLVEVPGVGQDKINAAFAYGGADLTVETLEDFLGLGVGGYIVIDFGGVEEIVGSLGGITLNVEQPIETEIDGQYFSVPQGRQTLNAEQALAYVRYRGGPSADIGRVGRQLGFVSALAREMASPRNLPRLPETLLAIRDSIDTNLNPLQMARFAVQLGLLGGDVPTEIYPGTPQYINDISYWVPDSAAGEKAVEETID